VDGQYKLIHFYPNPWDPEPSSDCADAPGRNFYERYMRRGKLRAGWVNPTDFEKEPLD
jgi:hypothetical protein